jgi:hypothetical protein
VLFEDGSTKQFSSQRDLNDMSMNHLPMPEVRLIREDHDSDGKVDYYKLSIKFRSSPKTVRHVNVLASFEYFIQKKLKLNMKGVINLSVDTPAGASRIIADGSLILK